MVQPEESKKQLEIEDESSGEKRSASRIFQPQEKEDKVDELEKQFLLLKQQINGRLSQVDETMEDLKKDIRQLSLGMQQINLGIQQILMKQGK